MGADAASAFLVGRLAMEGRQPQATLRATPGRWRGMSGAAVFAVSDGRLWLAEPKLLGDPAIASVPLSDIDGATLREGRRPQVLLRVAGRTLRYTALDDAETCRRFVEALTTSP
ncbi:hypothetical protein [Geodermatophilus sp. SYSU D00815]